MVKKTRKINVSANAKKVILLVILICIAGALLAATMPWGGAIKAFTIGTQKELPKPGESVTTATLEQGQPIRIQVLYSPKSVKELRVKFYKADEVVKDTKAVALNNSGKISLSTESDSLKPADYTFKVFDQDNEVVSSGSLKITEQK